MQVNVAWGLSPSDKQDFLSGRQGVLEEVLHSASRSVVLHPTQDPELGRISSMADCSSLLCLPLVRGMDVFGVLIYAHPDIAFFTEDRIELLEMVSHQAVIAIQKCPLYKDLAQEKERLVEIEDEARKRLARELHDGPVQSVAGSPCAWQLPAGCWQKNSTNTDSELAEIESTWRRRTVEEIRHMLFTLRPLVLESRINPSPANHGGKNAGCLSAACPTGHGCCGGGANGHRPADHYLLPGRGSRQQCPETCRGIRNPGAPGRIAGSTGVLHCWRWKTMGMVLISTKY
jgi:hypothetical protein